MSYLGDLEIKYMATKQECEVLQKRVVELEAQIESVTGPHQIPLALHLTSKEASLVSFLMERTVASKEQILETVYNESFHATGDIPELKIIDVFMCKIRRKFKPFGFSIETLWGHGYAMPGETKAGIRALAKKEISGDGWSLPARENAR